jgi:hypothetical protein
VTNLWYLRSGGTGTGVKTGESTDRAGKFVVSRDTTPLEKGKHEILGIMNVKGQAGRREIVVSRHHIVKHTVENLQCGRPTGLPWQGRVALW